jgi:hypothetical protein
MQTIYIKFLSEEDRARGFYELATRSRISSLPGAVYQVPLEGLKLLENQQIGYFALGPVAPLSSNSVPPSWSAGFTFTGLPRC